MAFTYSFSAWKDERLDVLISEYASMTRSRAANLIKDGCALIDGTVREKAGCAVKEGQNIILNVPDAIPDEAVAQDIDIDILYQDADVAVVYKPSGMVAHPAAGNPDGTLVNALLSKLDSLSGIGGVMRPGLVHRIDKDTSGLLLIAKNDFAHVNLAEQIAAHTVHRAYYAIVEGRLKEDSGFVDAPIGRHPTDRKKMAIVSDGREARTNWRVIEELKGASLIECVLTTGRTHQIRVHMSSINHCVLGDPVYSHRKMLYNVSGGQLLHAYRIGFVHPRSKKDFLFTAPPEERFINWYRKLGGTNEKELFGI